MAAHPPQFDPADPYLARLRTVALALPGAGEKLVVGHPAFYTRKVFGYFGMSYKVGVSGRTRRGRQPSCCRRTSDSRCSTTRACTSPATSGRSAGSGSRWTTRPTGTRSPS
ncbi:hypothetical protein [Tessaracoccus coleopterorum]|uniref:hypothetical protein n=1 Tax=Tessaracoccus coleopterorum TaxID=2714950 RepID=UPI0018D2C6E1|nr:hypothetical protein [Tessaracoccus coleopterorum]